MAVTERRRVSARRDSLLGDEPGAFASVRYARITPMKARRVTALVRGLPVDDALAVLEFAPQAASRTVFKVLESAVANATTTEDLDRAGLVVSKVLVDEGPTLKRWRPRAQGRATRINKKTSHITLVVQPSGPVEAKPEKRAAKKTAKKTAPAATETSSARAEGADKPAAKKTAKKAAAKKTAEQKKDEDA